MSPDDIQDMYEEAHELWDDGEIFHIRMKRKYRNNDMLVAYLLSLASRITVEQNTHPTEFSLTLDRLKESYEDLYDDSIEKKPEQ